MNTELLKIEVDLLVLKYGEAATLRAFAGATGSSEDAVRRKLATLKEKKTKSKVARTKKRPIDIAKDVAKDSAHEEQLLRLAVSYQNRQFLPQLKDVRRFLGRFNIEKSIKSRDNATRIVFETLNRCSSEELNDFLSDSNVSDKSSFSRLAGHIMGDLDSVRSDHKIQDSD